MSIRHHLMEIVNNEECNKVESVEIQFVSTVQYVQHLDHMHEIDCTFVHNMVEQLAEQESNNDVNRYDR